MLMFKSILFFKCIKKFYKFKKSIKLYNNLEKIY